MREWTLTKTRLSDGHWQGILHGGADTPPDLVAEHLGQPVGRITLTPQGNDWLVDLALPATLIADGAQCVILRRADSMAQLAVVTFIAGEDLAHDLRAEVAMLRAELDLLKRALRHLARGDVV